MQDYEVLGVASVDSRGQIVLPKDAREALGLGPASRLAVVVQRSAGRPCCLLLVPTQELEQRVREVVAPTEQTRGNHGS